MTARDRPGPTPDDDGYDGEFSREAELLRSMATDPLNLVDAPVGLWDQIASAARVEDRAEETPLRSSAPEEGPGPWVGPPPASPSPRPVDPGSHPRSRRSRRVLLASVAAAVVVVAAIGIGLLVTDGDDAPSVVASTELAPYGDGSVGAATATVDVIDDGGRLRLRVDMHDLPAPAPGTFYELWLIDPSTGRPVSVTTMDDGSTDVSAVVDLPPGTDTERYDVVDVSVQDAAAGPAHSGNSVLRGTLAT